MASSSVTTCATESATAPRADAKADSNNAFSNRSLGGVRVVRWRGVGCTQGGKKPVSSSFVSGQKAPQGRKAPSRESWSDFWVPGVFLSLSAIAQGSDARSVSSRDVDEEEQEIVDIKPIMRCVPGRWKQANKYIMVAKTDGVAGEPSARIGAASAISGLLLGTRLAIYTGLGHSIPTLVGTISSLLATGGATACVWSMENQDAGAMRVDMSAWTLVALAGVCGFMAPLPMSPLSKAAMAGVGGPVKLALPGVVGAIVIFEIGHRYWACIDPSQVDNQIEEERDPKMYRHGNQDGRLFDRVSKHWARHFMPSIRWERGIGFIYFAATLAVQYFAVNIDLSMTTWRKTFFNVLEAKDMPGLYAQMWDFAPIAVASTLAGIYSGYLTTIWDLRWREEITEDFVDMWLDKKSYYYVRFLRDESVDNFDQRLVQDTALFAASSRGLLCSFAEAILRLSLFGPTLIRISPTPLIWQICLALSLVSSVLTHLVGHPLASRGAALQSAEADFRSAMMRLRIFAEDIALQHGEGAEGASAARHFENVKAATWLIARGTMSLTTFASAYGLVGGILPFLVLVPSYFHGDISIGTMFQIESVMGGVQQSLGFFVGAYVDIAEWRASAGRLLALEAIVESASSSIPEEATGNMESNLTPFGSQLGVESLTMVSSSGTTLLENASFEWSQGDLIALAGAPGSGKSALLRMLAGAWPPPAVGRVVPFARGDGVLLVPSVGFLLPQRTAFRFCLAYPEADPPEDSDLVQALILCGLEDLASQLDVEADWTTALALCDRQRLVFARLVARWPAGVRWLLLDEVDTALDTTVASALHDLLLANLPPHVGLVITSSHNQILRRSGWRCFRIDPAAKQLKEEEPASTCGEAPGGILRNLGD